MSIFPVFGQKSTRASISRFFTRSAARGIRFALPARLFRTTTFRLALIYLLIFFVSVLPVLGFVYWNTAGFLTRQVDDTLRAEVAGLEELYRARSLAGLIESVAARSSEPGAGLYLLARADGTPLAGNLGEWPAAAVENAGQLSFDYRRDPDDPQAVRSARGHYFLLAGGVRLMVARDADSGRQFEALITNSLLWALAIAAALGLIGGIVMGRNMMQRVDAINRTSRDIMAGDLSHRVPISGSGDELDQLAVNLNAMLERIERLMQGMREVSDNIAHDLKSPLTRLRNRLEAALMSPREEADYAGALEDALDEADGLLKTFNALLSIARLEAGTVRDQIAPLDIEALVAGVAELYEPVAEEAGCRLEFRHRSCPPVAGHRELLSQALANLIDNALKYAPQTSGIEVSVAPDRRGNGVAIAVADHGPGIPPSERERVRQRFVRLEASRKTPGSGLGLSLVSAVARLHDGRLDLEATNREEPRGLTARIVLPAADGRA